MKTLIIYMPTDGASGFAILNGDYSHLNGVIVNTGNDPEKEQEVGQLLWNENGENLVNFTEDTSLVESKEWDKVAVITWIA